MAEINIKTGLKGFAITSVTVSKDVTTEDYLQFLSALVHRMETEIEGMSPCVTEYFKEEANND